MVYCDLAINRKFFLHDGQSELRFLQSRFFFLLGFLSITVFLQGCKIEPPKPPLVETVAVLPFDNESNDINAGDILQRYVFLALKPSVYKVMDRKEVNDKLDAVGIKEGGQLAAVDPTKLGRDLGVQALLYGDVTNFDYVNVGFYRHRKVSVDLKLVDVTSGQTLWENSGSALTPMVTLNPDEAKKEFGKGLADQLTDKMLKTPLDDESRSAAIKALKTLPGFQFSGFARDDESSDARTIGSRVIRDQINHKHPRFR